MSQYVPKVSPLSREKIERGAAEILQNFYPHLIDRPGIFPVLEFFDRLKDDFGLDPGVAELSTGVEGMTYPDGRVLVSESTYRLAAMGYGRDRFTVMHECSHGLLHSEQIRDALIDSGKLVFYRRREVPAYEDPEWQANSLASALLMPRTAVAALLKANASMRNPVQAVRHAFQVSATAAEIRLAILETKTMKPGGQVSGAGLHQLQKLRTSSDV